MHHAHQCLFIPSHLFVYHTSLHDLHSRASPHITFHITFHITPHIPQDAPSLVESTLPIIAIVAHYDTLSLVPSLSYGADSNGSGAVGVLALALALSRLFGSHGGPKPAYNVLFGLTSMGLNGYQGTRHWVDHMDPAVLQRIEFVLCLDSLAGVSGLKEGGIEEGMEKEGMEKEGGIEEGSKEGKKEGSKEGIAKGNKGTKEKTSPSQTGIGTSASTALYLHHSRPAAKDPTAAQWYQAFTAAAGTQGDVAVELAQKKVWGWVGRWVLVQKKGCVCVCVLDIGTEVCMCVCWGGVLVRKKGCVLCAVSWRYPGAMHVHMGVLQHGTPRALYDMHV